MCAIVRIGFTVPKQATAIACVQSREQIIEADANESWLLDEIYNRSHALADGDIRHCESLMNSRLRRGQNTPSILFETSYPAGQPPPPPYSPSRPPPWPFCFESKYKSRAT